MAQLSSGGIEFIEFNCSRVSNRPAQLGLWRAEPFPRGKKGKESASVVDGDHELCDS